VFHVISAGLLEREGNIPDSWVKKQIGMIYQFLIISRSEQGLYWRCEI
jgi:hypothetical protein